MMRFKLFSYSLAIILTLISLFLTTRSTHLELSLLTGLLLALITKGIRKRKSI